MEAGSSLQNALLQWIVGGASSYRPLQCTPWRGWMASQPSPWTLAPLLGLQPNSVKAATTLLGCQQCYNGHHAVRRHHPPHLDRNELHLYIKCYIRSLHVVVHMQQN